MCTNWNKWWKQFKLGVIKWCDFLSAFCLLFFGGIILGLIVFLGPQSLMSFGPVVPAILGIGAVIAPIFFRVLSSLTIQIGLFETYSNFSWLFIFSIVDAVLLFLVVKSYMRPEMLKGLKNIPACLPAFSGCVMDNQISSLDPQKLLDSQNLSAVATNAVNSAATNAVNVTNAAATNAVNAAATNATNAVNAAATNAAVASISPPQVVPPIVPVAQATVPVATN